MTQEDLTKMDIKDLKVLAYDQAAQINSMTRGLQVIEAEIARKSQPPVELEEKTDDVSRDA